MTQEKIEEVKNFFLDALPEKLVDVLKEYDSFTAQKAPIDAKSFGAYHLACKGALSHIALLLKLIQAVGPASGTSTDEETDWLMRAKAACLAEDEDEDT